MISNYVAPNNFLPTQLYSNNNQNKYNNNLNKFSYPNNLTKESNKYNG